MDEGLESSQRSGVCLVHLLSGLDNRSGARPREILTPKEQSRDDRVVGYSAGQDCRRASLGDHIEEGFSDIVVGSTRRKIFAEDLNLAARQPPKP